MISTREMEMPPGAVPSRDLRQAGLTLVEVLVAAFLLLTIAVFLLPVFVKAIKANNVGGEASQASNHAKTSIEQALAIPLDLEDLKLDAGSTELVLEETYMQTGPRDTLTGMDDELGDEEWIDNPASGIGFVPWKREVLVRNYSYADILEGTISVDGNSLSTLGHADYFDSPLPGGTPREQWHIQELEINIEGRREGGTLGINQLTRTHRFRVF